MLCIALLIASEWTGGGERNVRTETAVDPENYARQLESRLETLIREIRGAGEVRVLVTLRADGETVWACNDRLEQSSGGGDVVRSDREYVLLRSGTAENGLRVRTAMPTVQGVAVVCAGAGDPAVCRDITQTVTAALGVGASHVSIAKMQAERN